MSHVDDLPSGESAGLGTGESRGPAGLVEVTEQREDVEQALQHLLLTEVVQSNAAPAACALVAAYRPETRGWAFVQAAAGTRSWADDTRTTTDLVFDLASLTKPVFAVALARYLHGYDRSLSTELGELLPALSASPSGKASLGLLMSHRSGLAPHLELFAPLRDRGQFDLQAALQRAASCRRAECVGAIPAGGFPPVYSDLGFILAGAAASAWCHQSVNELVLSMVSRPLRVELGSAQEHRSRGLIDARFVPTETVAWRGGELVGVVHDDNCWALAGAGCWAHAGLFGRAVDVAAFACAFVDALCGREQHWLPSALATDLVRPFPMGSQRIGFDGVSPVGSSAGPRFGPHALGHLGFTGTSFWCEPQRGVVVTLLTNRVCPTRDNTRLRELRPRLHGALFDFASQLQ